MDHTKFLQDCCRREGCAVYPRSNMLTMQNSLLGMLTMGTQSETYIFEINFIASYTPLCV